MLRPVTRTLQVCRKDMFIVLRTQALTERENKHKAIGLGEPLYMRLQQLVVGLG